MSRRTISAIFYGLAWIAAGCFAWLLYRTLTGVSSDGRLQQVFLGIAIAAAIAIGNGASSLMSRRLPLSDEHHRLLMLGANWGVAAAAGWNVGVIVGARPAGW